jgi:hypothetical protein
VKKLTLICAMALLTTTAVFSTGAWAQSAKNAVQVSNLTLIPATTSTGGWITILGNANSSGVNAVTIHTSQQKDLNFGVSIECGLFTKTTVKSSGGVKDTEFASAGVRLRVLVDPNSNGTIGPQTRIAEPGSDATPGNGIDNTGITYCERKQTLSATLQGIIGNLACFPGGVFDPNAPGCSLTPEEIELVLNTLEANAFFHVLDDLGAGDHNVIVQARIDTAVSSVDAQAAALVGKGALTVEEVRLVKGAGILLLP